MREVEAQDRQATSSRQMAAITFERLEYRHDFGPGYRVYFGRDGDALIILLAGGTKKRQQRDIDTAQARWAAYKQRKNSEK